MCHLHPYEDVKFLWKFLYINLEKGYTIELLTMADW